MAYVISDECIMCGACQSECPVDAISEGDGKYVIDPDKCIECGACARHLPRGSSRPGVIWHSLEKAARKGRFFVPFRRTFGGGCNLPDGKMHPPFSAKRRRNRPDLAPCESFRTSAALPESVCPARHVKEK